MRNPHIDPPMWLGKPVFKGRGQNCGSRFYWQSLSCGGNCCWLLTPVVYVPERNFGEVAAGVWIDLYQARKVDVDRFLFAYLLLDYIM